MVKLSLNIFTIESMNQGSSTDVSTSETATPRLGMTITLMSLCLRKQLVKSNAPEPCFKYS